jgi:hypothetical protein
VSDVQWITPHLGALCEQYFDPVTFERLAQREWISLLLTRHDTLDAMFLSSARHLADHHQKDFKKWLHYDQLAMRYRISCVRALSDAINSEKASKIEDATVVTTLILAIDGVSACPYLAV